MNNFSFFVLALLVLVGSTYAFVKYPTLQTDPVGSFSTFVDKD
jgi:hypothetical protein